VVMSDVCGGNFDRRLHLVELALRIQPQAESGLWILLRKADRPQQNGEYCQTDIIGGAARERASGGDQTTRALSRGVQFTKEGTKVFRDRRHKASGGGTIGKASVLPQVAEHLQQVRLAAAEKPAHPCAALTRFADIVEEGANDLLNAIRVLPLADECLKLATQLGLRTFVAAVRNARLALIHQGMRCRVAL
jgi:hypothetical protein